MIRTLDDLALLSEAGEMMNKNTELIRKKHDANIVIMRHVAFIKKDVLAPEIQEKVTDLNDYLFLPELAHRIGIDRRVLLRRIYFMKKTQHRLRYFDYKFLKGKYFIKIDEDFKEMVQKYQPFPIDIKRPKDAVHLKFLGDLPIGFY